jgi:Zn-dependent M28 family amino/carboxypeptidase
MRKPALVASVLTVVFVSLAIAKSALKQANTASAHLPPAAIAALQKINPEHIRADVRFLSHDLLEGRGTGQHGGDIAAEYIATQFWLDGLRAAGDNGTFFQKVPMVGITPAPETTFELDPNKGESMRLKPLDEYVAYDQTQRASDDINADIVYVGYGVEAPEYQWDDYKGVDVRGKVLLMLVNEPTSNDPNFFKGRALTYYGRWTYKYEIGQQKGAAGVLIVHETGPAGYGFNVVQGKTGEQFDLVTPDKNMSRAAIEGWITLDKAKALMQMAGQDFDELKKQAATREFTPVPLGVTASMSIRNKLRTIDSRNVIARFDGADARLKNEYVVYTAHWDHFGKSPEGIFHGAEDDALGCAALIEMARAFTKVTPPPRRSIVFLAVTAEEQGLLGSQYYATMPIYPLARTAANINMDSWNVHGRTKDLTLIGYGASELDDYAAAAAAEQGRVVHADAEPEKGFYYRSDHFNFAKQGVPALNPDSGTDYIGKPADYAQKTRDDWNANRYHTPKDVVLPDWSLDGLREDLKVLFVVGYRVAQAEKMPEWKPGSEFKAKRDAMLGR